MNEPEPLMKESPRLQILNAKAQNPKPETPSLALRSKEPDAGRGKEIFTIMALSVEGFCSVLWVLNFCVSSRFDVVSCGLGGSFASRLKS